MKIETLKQYKIIEPVYEYSGTIVYKALDTENGRNAAIKISFKPETSDNKEEKEQFEKEIKINNELSHPNIVEIYDSGEEEDFFYIAMEYMDEGSFSKLRGRPVTHTEAAEILIPAAEALVYAHEKGILHLDIKPENVLLKKSENGVIPKLCDFGLSVFSETLSDHDKFRKRHAGTSAYMAPEQSLGEPLDERTDLYSFGVMFYELITGEKPFYADTSRRQSISHIFENIPDPRDYVQELPVEAVEFVFKAISKDPGERFSSMDEFIRELKLVSLISPLPEKKKLYLEQIKRKQWFDAAVSYYRQGDYFSSIELCNRIIDESPDNSEAYHLLGSSYEKNKQLQTASVSYHMAIKINPRSAVFHNSFGQCLSKMGKFDLAMDSFIKAIKFKPDFAHAYLNAGKLFRKIEEPENAEKFFLDALRLNPGLLPAYNNLGNVQQSLGKTEEAIESFKRALEINPKQAEVHYNIGNIYNLKGEKETAEDCYKTSLEIRPGFAHALHALAKIQTGQGKFDIAVKSLTKAIQSDPKYIQPHLDLAEAYYSSGELEHALNHYDEYLKYYPRAVDIFKKAGNVLVEMGNDVEARKYFEHSEKILTEKNNQS